MHGGGIEIGERGHETGAPTEKTSIEQLLVAPLAVREHEHAQTSHVASGKPHRVETMGVFRIDGFLLACAVEVLHAERDGRVVAQGIVDVLMGLFFEARAERVEVPVVVKEVGSGILGAAFWSDGVLIGIAVGDVDAGAGGDQLVEVCQFFGMDKRHLVLKAEIDDGGIVEVFPGCS